MPKARPHCNLPGGRRRALRRRRWTALGLVGALFLGSPARAEDAPETPASVAQRVQAAFEAGAEAELQALGARPLPDAWLVAEALLAGGHAEAAGRLPAVAPRKETEQLAAYVARRARVPVAAERLARLAAATAKLEQAPAEALEALAAAPGSDAEIVDVVAVRTLYARGRAHENLQHHEEAVAALEACARLAARLGWLGMASTAFERAARSASRRSDFAGALRLAGDWRAVEVALGSKQGQARVGCLMALFHVRLGELDKAAALSQQALGILEPLDDHAYLALALSNQGYVEIARGRLAPGRDLYAQAVARLERPLPAPTAARFAPDARLNARTRISLMTSAAAYTYFLGQRDEAWKQLDASAAAAEAAGEPELQARAQMTAGTLRQSAGELLEALASFEASVASYAAAGDRAGRADVLRRIGTVRHALGDYPAALASMTEALDVLVETGAAREAVLTRLAMALTHMANGEPQRAIEACRIARAAAEAMGATPLVASALTHMADAHVLSGEYAPALELHALALQRERDAKSVDGIARTLTDLGELHTLMGDTDKALQSLEEASTLLAESQNAALLAAVHLGVARARIVAGDDKDVGASLAKAHALFTQARDPRGAAGALAAAVVWQRTRNRDYAEAVRLADQLIAAYATLRDEPGLAMARLHNALALQALGRSDDALGTMRKALAAAEEASSVGGIVQCLWGLARLHAERGEDKQAMAAARTGLIAMNRLGRHLAEGEGAEARAQFAPLFDIGAAAAARGKDAANLYYFLESGRSATLLAALGGRDALRASVIPEDLRQAEADARAAEAMALAHLRQAQARGRLREVRTRKQAWKDASATVQSVIQRIQRTARTQANLVYWTVEPLETVQAGLAKDEVLCLYGLTSSRALALVVGAKDARVVDLGPTAEVAAACSAMLLGERPYIDEAKVAEARRLLIEPLGLTPGVRRVLVSPDGITAYLPFALLLEKREVSYVASASVHQRLAPEAKLRGKRILALGDPDYEKRGAGATQRSGERGGRGGALARLAATRDEVKAIGDDVLVGARASETELRKALAQDVRLRAIHLACHGLIDPQNPTLSSLALTADDENDGFLTALDVFRLQIHADLATLSACETGKGRVVRGEGIVGLTRAFLFAGSPRVIVSLWKVDDEATRALMVRFYELWNPKDGTPGIPAAAALREAQAYVRAQPAWKHPYYWGAWVLWGLPD